MLKPIYKYEGSMYRVVDRKIEERVKEIEGKERLKQGDNFKGLIFDDLHPI